MYNVRPSEVININSTNDEIKKFVFDSAVASGHLIVGTVMAEQNLPTTRTLEVQYLDDSGDLYMGFSRGKPVYEEIMKNPYISGSNVIMTDGRRGFGVRIDAKLVKVEDEKIYERYWAQNSGTKALYSKSLENFIIFRLTDGDGELFDLCRDDVTHRYRFSFGENGKARAWFYNITDACTACGACVKACMMDIISLNCTKAHIDHRGCLECGVCYENCAFGAITKGGISPK